MQFKEHTVGDVNLQPETSVSETVSAGIAADTKINRCITVATTTSKP